MQEDMGNHRKAITREMTRLMGIMRNGSSFSEAKIYLEIVQLDFLTNAIIAIIIVARSISNRNR